MQSQDPDLYKNLILSVVLSMAVLVAWEYFYARPQEEARRRAQEQSQQATPPATAPTSADQGIPSPGNAPQIGADRRARAHRGTDARGGDRRVSTPPPRDTVAQRLHRLEERAHR